MKVRSHLKEQDIEERMSLKWVLNEHWSRVWAGWFCLTRDFCEYD